jgi:hypothetical protein
MRITPPTALLSLVFLPLRAPALRAQIADFTIPPSGILPNYDRVSIGQREGLEGGAFAARTDDAGAGWYNPAGLALSEKSGLNASSNAYELTTITLEGIGKAQGSTRFSPSGTYFGAVLGAPVIKSPNWRIAFFYAKPVSWTPGSLDGSLSLTPGGNTEQLSYNTSSVFTTIIPGLAAGFRAGSRLRLGARAGLGMTTLHQVQSVSDRLITPGVSSTTGIRSVSSDGGVYQVLLSGGVQWDAGSQVKLGGLITSPGLRVGGSSKLLYSNTLFSGAGSREIGFRDENAKLEYKIPLELIGGVAVVFDRFQLEGDVRYHAGTDRFDLLSSEVQAQLITTDANGVPTQSTLTFVPVREKLTEVFNVALGGHYLISKGIRIHAGFFTDASPVADSDSSDFRTVDLVGASTGISFSGSHLSGSFGVSGSWGTTDNRAIGPSLGGIQGSTKIKVSTFTLLYAVSYAF